MLFSQIADDFIWSPDDHKHNQLCHKYFKRKCPFFVVVFLLAFLSEEGEKEKQSVESGGAAIVWDRGHFMVQRKSQGGDRMLSQATVTHTGT